MKNNVNLNVNINNYDFNMIFIIIYIYLYVSLYFTIVNSISKICEFDFFIVFIQCIETFYDQKVCKKTVGMIINNIYSNN